MTIPKPLWRFRPGIIWLLVPVIFSSFFLFWRLGENHLIEFDEGIYAVVAKNMVLRGDLLNMTITGASPWIEKPPLYFWLSSLSMRVLGFSSPAPRIPSVAFGVGTVILTFLLGKYLFNRRVGFIASVVLSSTSGFLYYARLGMTDVTLTFFVTGGLLFFLMGRKTPKYFLLMGTFFGLAFMTKNLIAILTLLIVLAYAFYEATVRKQKYFNSRFAIGLALSLLIPLPWHLYMYLKYGQTFLDVYFIYHVFARIGSAVENESAPFFWYIKVIRTQFRIWFVVLVPALAWSLYGSLKNDSYRFVLLASAVIFFGFSFSSSKLMWFIVPIYPGLAIIVAAFVDRILDLFNPKTAGLFIVLLISGAFLYNLKKLDRIISKDFNRDFVASVIASDKLSREKELLVFENYYVANYYNIFGRVSSPPKSEIRQRITDSQPVYLIVNSSAVPKDLDLGKYVKVAGRYNDYLLLEKF